LGNDDGSVYIFCLGKGLFLILDLVLGLAGNFKTKKLNCKIPLVLNFISIIYFGDAGVFEMMSELNILLAVRELLASPKRWTQGANARRRNGSYVSYAESAATQWCLNGAVQRVVYNEVLTVCDLKVITKAINLLVDNICLERIESGISAPIGLPIAIWNDAEERTHADVLVLLDKVIASLSVPVSKKRELEQVC
jgi:hypothetical protein